MKRLPSLASALCLLLPGVAGTAHAGQTGHGLHLIGAPKVAAKQGGPDAALDRLCNNHYNRLNLPVGTFAQIQQIIAADGKATPQELKTRLSAKNITLEEASWGLYYLGQKSLSSNDYQSFVKYLTVAADDYLNPWAMTLLAKVYYYDRAAWQKQFPQAHITTDKNLEKSYVYLTTAFQIGGQVEQMHKDNALLTGVTNGGLALKDTFEGTGVKGFDPRAALSKNQKTILAKADAYKRLYK